MALNPTWLNTCAAPDDASLSDGAEMGGRAAVGVGGGRNMTDDEYVGTLISNLVTPSHLITGVAQICFDP